ncbi:hypothetical protein GC722_09830 [Auraticoccus sp. F435]|uniref:Uncharacterized protein n=1 Tax=Auraticoccus cholistanensis TaxID=2656650 RepID=A0A6A9V117_9ACTN|nr:hypothetical protein [Auraticoccus cholistanensis]MVA76320.1 hypothetical protein [Auraticoccus cholistanensis]
MEIELSPDWSPLVLVLVLALACVLLYLGMRRQMKRLDANWSPQSPTSPDPDDTTRG